MHWFEEWSTKPDHLVRVEDLMFKNDRIKVNLVDAAGQVLQVGWLPQSLRNKRRDLMVRSQDFWVWIDERLQDMRAHGLLNEVDMSVEDITLIEMSNVRGLPKEDGTRTDPVIRFVAWSRP